MKKIMVFGCPRSGTTFTQSFFLNNNFYSPRETHFFMRSSPGGVLFRFGEILKCKSRLRRAVLTILNENKSVGVQFDLIDSVASLNRAQVLDRLLTIATERNESIGWIEKSPEHYRFVREIRKSINGIRFVHVIRDPVCTIASLRDASRKYGGIWKSYEDLRYCLRQYLRPLKVALRQRDHSDFLIVQYEGLKDDPEGSLKAISSHVDYELAIGEMEKSSESAQIVRPDEYWKREGRERDKISENLSEADINYINLKARGTYERVVN